MLVRIVNVRNNKPLPSAILLIGLSIVCGALIANRQHTLIKVVHFLSISMCARKGLKRNFGKEKATCSTLLLIVSIKTRDSCCVIDIKKKSRQCVTALKKFSETTVDNYVLEGILK